MTDRFVLIVARSPAGLAGLAGTPPYLGWMVQRLTPRVLFFGAPRASVITWARGIIVGSLIARGERAPRARLAPIDLAMIDAKGAATLIDCYWGSYVACLIDADERVSLVRAPFGDLPCLWHVGDTRVVIASDPELLACHGVATKPSPTRLAAYLGRPDYLGNATCLADIEELRGGEALRIGKTGLSRPEALWSPWRLAANEPRLLRDPRDAASRVGDAVRLSVAARTARHSRSLLLLSGGIDSSVVAASLARAGRAFTCLNFLSANTGDEERYARLVADACGAPLEIGARNPAGVDLERSAAAGQPRPVARAFMQESVRLAGEAAARSGASAVIDGGGGDSVFYAYLSAAPAAELWRREGWSAQFRATVGALATLSGVSRLKVTLRAIARAQRASQARRPPLLDYLSAEARAHIAEAAPHPWLTVPAGIGPGTASYVAGLAPVQGLVETQDPRNAVAEIAPLVTQPVIEACLCVPSWLWFEPWNSRVVIRRAFAEALPAPIIERRSKGTPESFVAGIFEARRDQIAGLLLDGSLAAMGLLDRPALASALAAGSVTRGYAFNRILRLVDAEAWLRSWAAGPAR